MAELTPVLREFLSAPRFAVVATIRPDGTPHQTVLWYELQGNEIMLNTAEGRVKDSNLRLDQRLSLCLEDGYRYLTLEGTAQLIEDQATAQADIAHLARMYHEPEQAEAMIPRFEQQQRLTIRMSIDHIISHGFEA